MAGGNGTRMYPLTTQIAKPLLPVGNTALVSFALEMIRKHKFEGNCLCLSASGVVLQATQSTDPFFHPADVIVVVQESASRSVAQLLETSNFKGEIFEIPDQTLVACASSSAGRLILAPLRRLLRDMGTADVLRQLKDKITTDFIVLSCDIISTIPLYDLIDLHRVNTAAVWRITPRSFLFRVVSFFFFLSLVVMLLVMFLFSFLRAGHCSARPAATQV